MDQIAWYRNHLTGKARTQVNATLLRLRQAPLNQVGGIISTTNVPHQLKALNHSVYNELKRDLIRHGENRIDEIFQATESPDPAEFYRATANWSPRLAGFYNDMLQQQKAQSSPNQLKRKSLK